VPAPGNPGGIVVVQLRISGGPGSTTEHTVYAPDAVVAITVYTPVVELVNVVNAPAAVMAFSIAVVLANASLCTHPVGVPIKSVNKNNPSSPVPVAKVLVKYATTLAGNGAVSALIKFNPTLDSNPMVALAISGNELSKIVLICSNAACRALLDRA
jgi:hypothetical protein